MGKTDICNVAIDLTVHLRQYKSGHRSGSEGSGHAGGGGGGWRKSMRNREGEEEEGKECGRRNDVIDRERFGKIKKGMGRRENGREGKGKRGNGKQKIP